MKKVYWRKLDGSIVAVVDGNLVRDEPDRVAVMPLNRVLEILFRRVKEQETVEVRFENKIVETGQDGARAWVDVETSSGMVREEGDYLIGCDGGSSTVRKSLFGKEFPGFTWEQSVNSTSLSYDGFEKHGWDDANYVVDPTYWMMCSKRSKDGIWRVTYGENRNLTNEELLADRDARLKACLPGHPDPHQYNILGWSPYRVHNRCVDKMRVGRIVLCADAAHLNSPFGGLGLTNGMVDVGALFDCLIGIHDGKADDDILDKYDEIRRFIFHRYIDRRSSKNMRRLFSLNPDTAAEDDAFLKLLNELNGKPKESKAFQLVSSHSR